MNSKDFDVSKITTVVTNQTEVTYEQLQQSGASSSVTYGIKVNDTIEFLDNYDDPSLITGRRIVNKNMTPEEVKNAPVEILVAVMRNASPSWYSISDCRRMDLNMKPVDDFREKMLSFSNDHERLQALAGTTIKASNKKIEYEVVKKFVRDENGRMTPEVDSEGKIIPNPRKRVTYETTWIVPEK
jgi:hypothetical protein